MHFIFKGSTHDFSIEFWTFVTGSKTAAMLRIFIVEIIFVQKDRESSITIAFARKHILDANAAIAIRVVTL
jgi:hypothetical protein